MGLLVFWLIGMALSSSPTYWVVLVWWFQARKPWNLCWWRELICLSQHSQQVKRGCWGKKLSSLTKETTMPNWESLFSAPSCPKELKTSSPTSNPLPTILSNPWKGGWLTPTRKWRQWALSSLNISYLLFLK